MEHFFQRLQNEGVFAFNIEGTARAIEDSPLKDSSSTQMLFEQLQSQVAAAATVFAIKTFVDPYTYRYAKAPPRTTVRWDTKYEFGKFSELGEIVISVSEQNSIIIRFTSADFTSSSVKGTFKAAVIAMGLTAFTVGPEALTKQGEYHYQITNSKCATNVTVRLNYGDYLETLWTGFGGASTPNDERAAAAMEQQPAQETICILQIFLNTRMSAGLQIDGIFGRQTYYAWQRFKTSLGPNKSDAEALATASRFMRQDLNFAGTVLHEVATRFNGRT